MRRRASRWPAVAMVTAFLLLSHVGTVVVKASDQEPAATHDDGAQGEVPQTRSGDEVASDDTASLDAGTGESYADPDVQSAHAADPATADREVDAAARAQQLATEAQANAEASAEANAEAAAAAATEERVRIATEAHAAASQGKTPGEGRDGHDADTPADAEDGAGMDNTEAGEEEGAAGGEAVDYAAREAAREEKRARVLKGLADIGKKTQAAAEERERVLREQQRQRQQDQQLESDDADEADDGSQGGASTPTDHGNEADDHEDDGTMPTDDDPDMDDDMDDAIMQNFPVTPTAHEAFEAAVAVMGDQDADAQTAYCTHLLKAVELEHPSAVVSYGTALLFGNVTCIPRDVSKAAHVVLPLADAGFPAAQALAGFMYSAGLGVNSSQARSILYTTFAALGGDTFAQMNLGYRHLVGLHMKKSCEVALTHYRKVADRVFLEASEVASEMVERVRLADEKKRKRIRSQAHILQYYQLNAQQGSTESQVVMGQLYYQGGHGYPQDFDRAAAYFQEAAGQGDAAAMAYLGEMYANGRGVAQNNATAKRYYERGVEKKNPQAIAGLGMLYKVGQGVKKDEKKAFELFKAAADMEDPEGHLRLAHQYYDGLGVQRDYRKAIRHYSLAAQQGHVLAMYSLGLIHATGTGTSRNCELAAGLFKNVAERGSWAKLMPNAYAAYEDGATETATMMYLFLGELGYEMAQNNAAYILDETPTDNDLFDTNGSLARALYNWQRSADQGHTAARLKVGDYHYYGYAVDPDYTVAANEYRLAADASNAQAMFNLGWMHEHGVGLPVDLFLAKRFYDSAAETAAEARLPSAIALWALSTKMWFDGADLATYWPGLSKDIERWNSLRSMSLDDLQNISLSELLTNYENTMLAILVVFLAVLLLARQLQDQQHRQQVAARAQAAQAAQAQAEAQAAAAAEAAAFGARPDADGDDGVEQ